MKKIFSGVAGNNPKLNRFDLSYTNTTSMQMGYLYPVQCDEVYPGDVFKMSAFCHAEVMPLVAPLMSDIQIFAHTFFVPYRLIYGIDNSDGKPIWEKFITGGQDGDYETPLPSWNPDWTDTGFSTKKIWDYIGNPVEQVTITPEGEGEEPYKAWQPVVPSGLDVSIAPKYAYNFIYNSFYRDENLIDEVALTNEDLLLAAFKKDYFTSALEQQQRGTAPALPVDITGSAAVKFFDVTDESLSFADIPSSNAKIRLLSNSSDRTRLGLNTADSSGSFSTAVNQIYSSVDLSGVSATTFTVSDMRLAFAIQRLLELNERAGVRFTEFLSSHYGVSPTDARLDRPEYIGGAVMAVSVSPLIQTSETASTPQGNKSGVGHVDSIQKIGNYRVLEHGLIMTLVSIRPKPIYQQGIDRQWLRQTRFDYYIPELAYLSEQGVYRAELYVDPTDELDNDIFGYQAHWNEMRCKNNRVSGAVREQFDYYATARKFDSRPSLNKDFIEIVPSDFNKIFAVQDEDNFIVSWSSIIDAYRPIPAMGVPGLVDHVYGGF